MFDLFNFPDLRSNITIGGFIFMNPLLNISDNILVHFMPDLGVPRKYASRHLVLVSSFFGL